MNSKIILLVEDNPSDVALTQRALAKSHVANELVVAEDGREALDYLFGAGAHAGRDVAELPALVLLDLKMPRVAPPDSRRQRQEPLAGGHPHHLQGRAGCGAKLRPGR